MGSNALLLNSDQQLILCQHGDRRMARMDAPLQSPKPVFSTLAQTYMGKKLNSPNDAIFRSNGDLVFTDPPYGLEKNMLDPAKETPFQGVYLVTRSGNMRLLIDSVSRPNGIALMPGEKSMIIANSDSTKPVWYRYEWTKGDSLEAKGLFYDASLQSRKSKGLPDGLKIDRNGNVFATGPGGVFIFNQEGKLLGRILIPVRCSNIAFGEDEKTIFITATMYVLRLVMRK